MKMAHGKFSSSKDIRMRSDKYEKGAEMIIKYFSIAALVMVAFVASGCAITNKFDSYSGKVVDSGTKQPIGGAVVLVVYYSETYGLAGSVTNFEGAQEVLTDKNGEFRVPAKRTFTFRILSGWARYPRFTIFKPGYGCYPEHKDVSPLFEYGSLPSDQYVTIELPKLIDKEERLRNNACLQVRVPHEKMRLMLKLDDEDRAYLGLERRYPERGK